MTIRLFLLALLVTLARALLAHGCGEGLRFILARIAPGLPPLFGITIGLLLGVILIDIVVHIWRRRARSRKASLMRD